MNKGTLSSRFSDEGNSKGEQNAFATLFDSTDILHRVLQVDLVIKRQLRALSSAATSALHSPWVFVV